MFEDKELIEKYGSWVRVQVAFYDFIFQAAIELCPEHFRETFAKEAMSGGFAEGEDLYERSVLAIENHFVSVESAWSAFKRDVL